MNFFHSLAILLTLGFANSLFGEPQKPFDLLLDENAILKIPIHPDIGSLLVFPEPVTLLLGTTLTEGTDPGVVQFQHGENKRVVVLRHLGEGNEDVLMQVMLGEKAHVFRLQRSDTPASVIRFKYLADKKPPAAKPVAVKEISKREGEISPQRQQQLMRLAILESFLKPSLPEDYEEFASLTVNFAHRESGFLTKVTKISRFASEDALVISGSIKTENKGSLNLAAFRTYLLVGKSRSYRLSQINFDRASLAPDSETTFQAILIGNGQGGPAHLSHENEVRLRLFR